MSQAQYSETNMTEQTYVWIGPRLWAIREYNQGRREVDPKKHKKFIVRKVAEGVQWVRVALSEVADPRIGTLLGMYLIEDDYSGLKDGEIFALGEGAIATGKAPVTSPVGYERSEAKNGGETAIFTRVREVLHPDGMIYTVPSTLDGSPTVAELTAKANWSLAHTHECVPIAKVTLKAGVGGP